MINFQEKVVQDLSKLSKNEKIQVLDSIESQYHWTVVACYMYINFSWHYAKFTWQILIKDSPELLGLLDEFKLKVRIYSLCPQFIALCRFAKAALLSPSLLVVY